MPANEEEELGNEKKTLDLCIEEVPSPETNASKTPLQPNLNQGLRLGQETFQNCPRCGTSECRWLKETTLYFNYEPFHDDAYYEHAPTYHMSPPNSKATLRERLPKFFDQRPRSEAPVLSADRENSSNPYRRKLIPLDDVDVPEGYPPLDYLPISLRWWSLLLTLLVLANCIFWISFFLYKSRHDGNYRINARSGKMQATIRYAPMVVGVSTRQWIRIISTNVAKYAPYISMASKQPNQMLGRRTLAAAYYPLLGETLIPAFGNRHYSFFGMYLMDIISALIVTPFKSVLIIPADDFSISGLARVTFVPAILLLLTYVGLFIAVMMVLIRLTVKEFRSGLKWDPVSIADHLVLFSKSNILHHFQGSERILAEQDDRYKARKWLMDKIGDHYFRLGYWKTETNEIWHGIGEVWPDSEKASGPDNNPDQEAESKEDNGFSEHMKPADVLRSRYDSWDIFRFTGNLTFITFLSIGSLVALIWGYVSVDNLEGGFNFGTTYEIPTYFLWRVLPVGIGGLYLSLWRVVDLNQRTSQAFDSMYKPKPACKSLTLDYHSLPIGVVTYRALLAKHFRVALFSLCASTLSLIAPLIGSLFTPERVLSEEFKAPQPQENSLRDFLENPENYLLRKAKYVVRTDMVAYKLCLTLFVLYSFTSLFVWKGSVAQRRHHMWTGSLGNLLVCCYASKVLQNPAFLSTSASKDREDMVALLRLQKELYALGIYHGTDGKIHVGLDVAGRINSMGRKVMLKDFSLVIPTAPWKVMAFKPRLIQRYDMETRETHTSDGKLEREDS